MATRNKAATKATRWSDGITPLDQLAPNEQLAHEMVVARRDLTPSVERIMGAELSDEQRSVALVLFRDSLERIGDPSRDPRVAIRNAAAS